MEEIKTKRLLLRNFEESDLDDLFDYSKNPNVGVNAGWEPHKSKQESLEILRAIFLGKKEIYAIVLSGKVIGSVGLMKDPKRENDKAKMLGYALGEPYWGKGIMTEAVQAVLNNAFVDGQTEIISANCYPDNIRSKKVIEKNGFVFEGILRQAEVLYNGEIKDHCCYSLTRREFLSGGNYKEENK